MPANPHRTNEEAPSMDRRAPDSTQAPPHAVAGVGAAATPEHALESVLLRPEQLAKTPPCSAACATGSDVRGWIGLVAQRGKLGLTDDEAFARAWNAIAAVNPFPATLGRICPHPCESGCNREGKDGAVAINALERYLGDWGLGRGLDLLRRSDRTLLSLIYIHGLSYQEAAKVLDRPIGSIGPLRGRALKRLSRVISQLETPPETMVA